MRYVSIHHFILLGSLSLLFGSSIFVGFGISDNLSNSEVCNQESREPVQSKQEKETDSKYYKVVYKSEEDFGGDSSVCIDGLSVDASELVKAVEEWLKTVSFEGIPDYTAKAIKDVLPGAILSYYEKSIFPSVTVYQYILESDHGRSTLTSQYNNGFGIKAGEGWSGGKVLMWTQEDYGNGVVWIQDYFRVYDNLANSIVDHADFLDDRAINGRYTQAGVFDAKDGPQQIACIRNAGYATDQAYISKYIGMCADYDLLKYDKIADELIKKVADKNNENTWKPDGTMGWLKEYNIGKKSLSVDRVKILNEGHKLLGVPYMFGADSPPNKNSNGGYAVSTGAFDCSSFVRYVIKQSLGIDITRSTFSQIASSTLRPIKAEDVKPGDLVYDCDGGGSPNHVVIYIGKGSTSGAITALHCPTEGETVKIANYSCQNSYFSYYRVVGIK